MRSVRTGVCVAAVAVLAAGCVTGGENDRIANVIYATHASVIKLEKGLGGSIQQLNATAADLTARVDSGDQQTRELRALIEENQVKLNHLSAKVDRLTNAFYQVNNLTPPSSPPIAEVEAPTPKSTPAPAPAPTPVATPAPEAPQPSIEPLAPPDEAKNAAAQPSAPAPAPAAPATEPASPEAAKAEPASVPGNAVTAYEEARASYVAQNYERALGQYQACLKQYPDAECAERAEFWVAQCYMKLDRSEDAAREFEAFRKKYPSSSRAPVALHNEAAARLKLGQSTRAVELLKDLVEKYPMSPATEGARAKLREMEAASGGASAAPEKR